MYDDWGKLVSIDTADAETSTAYREIAEANPLRYRGYYYDNETGYYYLQSRYYDPSICRFINADVYCDTGTSTYNSYNMFAYCENNPVNCLDYTGEKLIIRKDANKFFKEIKKITFDTLSMNKSGNISIKTRAKRPKKIYGTDLLRTIIESDYTVNIYTTSKGSYYSPANKNAFHPQKKNKYIWGKGSGGNIYIDSKQAKKKDPLFIIIAHELGHSYRGILGVLLPTNLWSKTYRCYLEEVFNVGLINPRAQQYYQTTAKENNIRSENGIPRRNSY